MQAESRDGEKYNQRDRNWVRTRYPELRSEFSERAMIKLDPTDRWSYKEKRSAPLGAIAVRVISESSDAITPTAWQVAGAIRSLCKPRHSGARQY